MIVKGMVATTKIDAHNMRITLDALKKAADDINNGEYAPSVGVEHDPTILPIGKVIKAYIEKIDDNDYGLYCEQDMFSAQPIALDGETFIVQKSLVNDKPLSSAVLEPHEKLFIQTDFVNFPSNDGAKNFLQELSEEYDIETGYISRKSVIPDPELIFQYT